MLDFGRKLPPFRPPSAFVPNRAPTFACTSCNSNSFGPFPLEILLQVLTVSITPSASSFARMLAIAAFLRAFYVLFDDDDEVVDGFDLTESIWLNGSFWKSSQG